ncbi:2TM domain-containing protein [Myxococcota bacterium]|nr:2TM domain-containing protein [Myxococcota bacterium]
MARIDFEEEEKRRDSEIARAARAHERRGHGGRHGLARGPEQRLVDRYDQRRAGLIGHLVAYGMVLALLLVTAGPSSTLVVALSWGIGVFFHAFGFANWAARHRPQIEGARRALASRAAGGEAPAGIAAPAPDREDLPGTAGELQRRCEDEAAATARLLAASPGDPARAAEVEATVRGGLERIRALLRHRASMERALATRGEADLAREREDLLARIAATEDPRTQEAYRESLGHLDSLEAGMGDLRAIAERIDAQARAFAEALKVMQVDLLRLQAAEGLDEPTRALGRVAERAQRLSGEVQSVRDLMDEVARSRRERQGEGG